MAYITLSNSQMGCRVYYTESVDVKNNTSKITITDIQVMSTGWTAGFYPGGSIYINGTEVARMSNVLGTHSVWLDSTYQYVSVVCHRSYYGSSYDLPQSITITHNSDGSKSVSIEADLVLYGTSGYLRGSMDVSGTITLTSIDRAAPTVSVTATPVSSSSITIKGTSSATANLWEYSINGGSTWVQYSTASGTSASITLTGLSSGTYSIKVRARKSNNNVKGTSGAVSCDITLPTISFKTSSITANSVYVSATAGTTCDRWEYSKDNGTTWVQFSTSAGTTASVTISGLTPNTSYTIKVRVRKKANQLYNTSSGSTIKTLGGTVINTASTVTIDIDAPVLTLNWTVYDASYTHTLYIKNGSTTVLTITGLTGSVGTNNKTINFTASQRTTILNAMSALASFTATYELRTYSGSTQIGDASTKTGTIKTTSSTSKPTLGTYTYSDTNTTTSNLVSGALVFIQMKSSLRVVFAGATPKNGASISKYKVTVGSKTAESSTTTVSFGAIAESGSATMTLSVTDSRGYTTSTSVRITVIDYENIVIKAWSIRRVNEVEESTELTFTGELSEVSYGDTARNSLQTVKYRYKKTSASSYGSWTSLSGVDDSGSSFSFDGSFITFDPEFSFDIQLQVTDMLTTFTVQIFLNKGTPLVAFRAKRIGINQNNPSCALDVSGAALFTGGIHAIETVSASSASALKTFMQTWYEALDNGSSGLWICNCSTSGLAGLGAKGYWFVQVFRISATDGVFFAYSITAGTALHQAALSNGTLGDFAAV